MRIHSQEADARKFLVSLLTCHANPTQTTDSKRVAVSLRDHVRSTQHHGFGNGPESWRLSS